MWLGRWLGCWLILACVTAVPGAAAPRVGPLEVRTGPAGGACFTIPETEELRGGAPQFDAISVTDGASPKVSLWSMTMPRERTFTVSFRMCIPYAGRLPVLPRTVAATLARGRVYEVTLVPRTPEAGAPRVYRARFCLGARGVQQLSAGESCAV